MIQHASIFSQLLTIFPRAEFATLVRRNRSDYGAKGFNSWTQLVCMLFCHLAQAKSLREICNGLRCCLGKLRHLGIVHAPNKSTLSYANEHRTWQLYQETKGDRQTIEFYHFFPFPDILHSPWESLGSSNLINSLLAILVKYDIGRGVEVGCQCGNM